MTNPARRDTTAAIALHWLIGLGILAMGLVMTHAPIGPLWKFRLYQWHKSVGITVLVLAALRPMWRLVHQPPALPVAMPRWETRAAEGTPSFSTRP